MTRVAITALLLTTWATLPFPARAQRRLDDSQARLVLRFLGAVEKNEDAKPLIDSIMAAPGTGLVIAQQNLSRRVSAAEYREVLVAFAEHRDPRIAVDTTDPRAVKGREGLLHDVLPTFRWGAEHLDLLAARLDTIGGLDIDAAARRMALENLPERVPLEVSEYLVMGGRAGAAATAGGIYFDVLVTSHRSGDHFPAPGQVVEFFAHELHHVGMEAILDSRERRLRLDDEARRALDLVRGLVMEGSASYLINGHRDLAAMRIDPGLAAPGDDRERMARVERILSGVLESHWTDVQYERAMTDFTGNSLHMTGAAMLDAIWHAGGRKAVMAVLLDPRLLLGRYDETVARTTSSYRFPEDLAHRLAELGGSAGRERR